MATSTIMLDYFGLLTGKKPVDVDEFMAEFEKGITAKQYNDGYGVHRFTDSHVTISYCQQIYKNFEDEISPDEDKKQYRMRKVVEMYKHHKDTVKIKLLLLVNQKSSPSTEKVIEFFMKNTPWFEYRLNNLGNIISIKLNTRDP